MNYLEQPNPNTLRPLSGGFPVWRILTIALTFFAAINVSNSLTLGYFGLVAALGLTFLSYRVTALIMRRFPANAWMHYFRNITVGQKFVAFREEEVLPVVWHLDTEEAEAFGEWP